MEAEADVKHRLQEVQPCGLIQPVVLHSLDTEPMSWYFWMVESLPHMHIPSCHSPMASGHLPKQSKETSLLVAIDKRKQQVTSKDHTVELVLGHAHSSPNTDET